MAGGRDEGGGGETPLTCVCVSKRGEGGGEVGGEGDRMKEK